MNLMDWGLLLGIIGGLTSLGVIVFLAARRIAKRR